MSKFMKLYESYISINPNNKWGKPVEGCGTAESTKPKAKMEVDSQEEISEDNQEANE